MINCDVSGLGALCAQLMLEDVARTQAPATQQDMPITPREVEQISGWFRV